MELDEGDAVLLAKFDQGGRLFRLALLPGAVGLLIATAEEFIENVDDDDDRDDGSHVDLLFSLIFGGRVRGRRGDQLGVIGLLGT